MKIEYKTGNFKPLREVCSGEVFTINNEIYIATIIDDDQLMVVNLEDGEVAFYSRDINVKVLDCYLVVR